MIRLNAGSYKGKLFTFCSSMTKIRNMVTEGVMMSLQEPTMYGRKKYDRTGYGETEYVSFTHSPSTITQAGEPRWKYGLVVDGDKLNDTWSLRPYFYNGNRGEKSVYFYQDDNGDCWVRSVIGTYKKISENDFYELLELYLDKSRIKSKEIECFYEHDPLCPDPKEKVYVITFNNLDRILDEEEQKELEKKKKIIEEKKEKGIEPSDEDLAGMLEPTSLYKLPGIVYQMFTRSGYESEERLYPRKRDGGFRDKLDMKRAIVGVIVPDVEYFNDEMEDFREDFPNLTMWVYRAKDFYPASGMEYETIKAITQGPDGDWFRRLYRIPR